MSRKSELEKLKKEFPYEYNVTKKWHKIFECLKKAKNKFMLN